MDCKNVNNIEDESEIDDNIVNESQYHYRDDVNGWWTTTTNLSFFLHYFFLESRFMCDTMCQYSYVD